MLGNARAPHLVDELLEIREGARQSFGPIRNTPADGTFQDAVAATILYLLTPATPVIERFPAVAAPGIMLVQGAKSGFNGTDETLFDDLGWQAVQTALERIPRIHALDVDPGFPILPMHVIAEELSVELVYVRIIGEQDVPGVIEGETVLLNGPAPTADLIVGFQQQGAGGVKSGG